MKAGGAANREHHLGRVRAFRPGSSASEGQPVGPVVRRETGRPPAASARQLQDTRCPGCPGSTTALPPPHPGEACWNLDREVPGQTSGLSAWVTGNDSGSAGVPPHADLLKRTALGMDTAQGEAGVLVRHVPPPLHLLTPRGAAYRGPRGGYRLPGGKSGGVKSKLGPALCHPTSPTAYPQCCAWSCFSVQQTINAAHRIAPWNVLERPPSESWTAMLRTGVDLCGLLRIMDISVSCPPCVGNRKNHSKQTHPNRTRNVGRIPLGPEPSCRMKGDWSPHLGT